MVGLLRLAGRNGALVVIAGIVFGIAFPFLADLARPFLAAAVFAFTFGSFLKLERDAIQAEMSDPLRNILIVTWATLGCPLIVFALIWLLQPGADISQGLLLWAMVPTSAACVAFAAILKLNAPIALLTTVTATAAAPFLLPLMASALGGISLTINPVDMCLQLLLIIASAGASAFLIKRFAGDFVRQNPDAMTGISVVALVLAGLGSMRGMQTQILAQPALVLKLLMIAYAAIFSLQLLGTVLFWRCDRQTALTAGLVSGTRTITLAWVVLGADISPVVDVFLGCAMIAKYTTPALTRALIRWLQNAGPAVTPVIQGK